jgi:hypothetical protein
MGRWWRTRCNAWETDLRPKCNGSSTISVVKASMLVAALAAVLLALPADGAPPAGGLYGVATRGPTKPVCRVGEPCTEPAAAITLTFVRAGRAAGRVRTGALGGYRIHLAPGLYAVRTSAAPFGVVPAPSHVRVLVRMRRVDFSIDTGIR